MTKKYYDFYREISADEMYEGMIRYGIFSEKLPPIFDASDFWESCKNVNNNSSSNKWRSYVNYTSIRNINTPRRIGIPVPMAYEYLCRCLRDYWDKIQEYFERTTNNQRYIVSRIHIRKLFKSGALFEMNYDNWRDDGSPEEDIMIGKKYLVKVDISQCFPSIYTHAIPWALVTKEVAKNTASKRYEDEWYNLIDKAARYLKNGETQGVLIGPHVSNILSEIVLSAVDKIMCSKWDYVRNIDDYTCYVRSKEEAEEFIIELGNELGQYGLLINHKKTQILELPQNFVESWVRQIKDRSVYMQKFQKYVDYNETRAFLDNCIVLMNENKENASIILYGVKILNGFNLTKNAKRHVEKTMMSLAVLYPYIVPILGEQVFDTMNVENKSIEKYVNILFEFYINKGVCEPASYALYYASKYNVKIDSFDVDVIIKKNDCILALCALIYCRCNNLENDIKQLKKYAREIKDDMDEYWPFVYECLPASYLNGEWKNMKKNKISFIKKKFR